MSINTLDSFYLNVEDTILVLFGFELFHKFLTENQLVKFLLKISLCFIRYSYN